MFDMAYYKSNIPSGPEKKLDRFYKFVTRVCDDIQKRSVYQTVRHIVLSKSRVLNFVKVKYSLH